MARGKCSGCYVCGNTNDKLENAPERGSGWVGAGASSALCADEQPELALRILRQGSVDCNVVMIQEPA